MRNAHKENGSSNHTQKIFYMSGHKLYHQKHSSLGLKGTKIERNEGRWSDSQNSTIKKQADDTT